MSRARILLAVALLGVAPTLARANAGTFMRGMALGQYSDIPDGELTSKLNELRYLGVSHVSLVVSWSTKDIYATRIAPAAGLTTPDAVMARMIARTRALGFRVFLFPILDVQNRKASEWRGALRPPNWDAWWKEYRRFVLHYAALATQTKADLFCVGSELVTTEHMRNRWKELIAAVRKVYKGKIVYSANWDHYSPVTFWDLVDVMGLTAYYKLAETAKAAESEMVASWKAIRVKLVSWSRRQKRPIVFTEVGYPSLDGCAVMPWDYTRTTPVNLEEQRRAYSAFVQVWRGVRELTGVYFWDWYGDGGKQDRSYTPRGKPSAEIIRRWYVGMDR